MQLPPHRDESFSLKQLGMPPCTDMVHMKGVHLWPEFKSLETEPSLDYPVLCLQHVFNKCFQMTINPLSP